MLNLTSLNQRVNALTAKVNNIVPGGTQDLATTLTNGNSAGSNDIDMNNQDILQVNNIDLVTINGSAYPPAVDDLQAVLTAGNDSDLSIVLKDNLVTPTSTTTLSNGSLGFSAPATTTVTSYSAGGLSVATGDINTLGTAGITLGGIANNNTTLTLANSQATAPPFFSPPQGVATLTTTPSTSALQLSYSGQFTVGKSVTMDLDKVLHQADGNLPFAVTTNGNLTLNAGDTTFGFKKVQLCPTSTSNAEFDSATGKMSLLNANAGNIANPQLVLTNTNATGSVAMEVYKAKPTPAVNGEVLFTQSVFGKDSGNAKQEFTRINHTVRDVTAGVEDGSIEFGCFVNGAVNTFLQINGNENEVNLLRPLDMTGNTIRTTTGDMSILSTTSTGTGVMTIASKGALNIGSATDNIIATSSLQMTADKQIFLTDSSPAVVATQLGNGEIRVDDLTNFSRAIVAPTAFSIQDTNTGPITTYSLSGFFNSDNSILCNSNNGFVLNNGSTTNKATVDLQKVEVFNSGVSNQDTILLQNTGSGNPVLNLQTSNTSTNILDAMGASTSGIGVTRTNQLTFANKQVSINVPPSSPCIIQHFDNLDNQQFIIGTPNSLQLDMGQDFILNGSNIISGSSSGNSGQHLRILLNGTYYKIKLEND